MMFLLGVVSGVVLSIIFILIVSSNWISGSDIPAVKMSIKQLEGYLKRLESKEKEVKDRSWYD